jgi:DNA-binding transcriptional MerR regulator
MTQEFMSVREVCEALRVSRAMVQKLEASGELKRARENGRVVFERARVEALAYAREVAKAQRVQEAEQREVLDGQTQLHREAVEFDASAQSAEDQDARRSLEQDREGVRSQLNRIQRQLQDLQAAEAQRRHEASLAALSQRREPCRSTDGDLMEALTTLAPAAALLAIAWLAREQDKKDLARSEPAKSRASGLPVPIGLPDGQEATTGDASSHSTSRRIDSLPNGLVEGAAPRVLGPGEHDAAIVEEAIVKKLATGSASKEDLQVLASLMCRRASR